MSFVSSQFLSPACSCWQTVAGEPSPKVNSGLSYDCLMICFLFILLKWIYKYININTCTLHVYFNILLLYSSTPLHFGVKYSTFYRYFSYRMLHRSQSRAFFKINQFYRQSFKKYSKDQKHAEYRI